MDYSCSHSYSLVLDPKTEETDSFLSPFGLQLEVSVLGQGQQLPTDIMTKDNRVVYGHRTASCPSPEQTQSIWLDPGPPEGTREEALVHNQFQLAVLMERLAVNCLNPEMICKQSLSSWYLYQFQFKLLINSMYLYTIHVE